MASARCAHFNPDIERNSLPESVKQWRSGLTASDAVFIARSHSRGRRVAGSLTSPDQDAVI